MNKIIIFAFFILPIAIFSRESFIVSDVKTDEILYIENRNYANTDLFPGSLLKPFAILSIENDSEVTHKCTGWSNMQQRCWLRESHGKINLIEALAYSCNSYFIQYFTKKINLEQNYELLSYYLSFKGKYSEKEFIEESIGLGTSIKTTPVEILKSYNKLFREKPEGIEIIRQGMKECIYYGTGELFSDITGVIDAACKTGTSYRIKDNGEYDWRNNTGWFLIMYPADEPKYSFLYVTEITTDKKAVKVGSKKFHRWISEN